ncbi:MAG: ASCH domain-containing protein [Spirochaetales bacterium]|nr:ASCH domain-containing protein [Spirochaetales bacterium]
MTHPSKITFFDWLIPYVESGKKTITIRDETESHYVPGTIVEVYVLETDRKVCNIEIVSVVPITFDEISAVHAEQEHMELPKLKQVIKDIYPDIDKLYVISYKLV